MFNLQVLVANKNSDEMALKVWGIHEAEIPPWQKSILKVTLPLLKKFLINVLEINKEVSALNFNNSNVFHIVILEYSNIKEYALSIFSIFNFAFQSF